MKSTDSSLGSRLHAFAGKLYPICRSITGDGLRKSLQMVKDRIPLKLYEVRSGTKVFDWEVPLEWNIDAAYIADQDGKRVVDFHDHNLHIVGYSAPISQQFSLAELQPHLHAHAASPDWIPYRTSYYNRNWGFCLRGRDLQQLRKGTYQVHVDSSLAPGSLTYGECVIPGTSKQEVLLFTHACHPSLANDNASGMAIVAELAEWLAESPRRFTYRLVFAPGTIGSLCWLKHNQARLGRVRHGLVLGLLGDAGPLRYKQSRSGKCDIDALVEFAIREMEPNSHVMEFEPYGYDERQLCSPGFDLPVGRLTRSHNGAYPEYHSSGDDMALIKPQQLARSLEVCQRIVSLIENNRQYVNLNPKGEPRLGKRGLYSAVGGQSPAAREHAMLWILNQSDGTKTLLDVARRSKLPFDTICAAATDLHQGKLLREMTPIQFASAKRVAGADRQVKGIRGSHKAKSKSKRQR